MHPYVDAGNQMNVVVSKTFSGVTVSDGYLDLKTVNTGTRTPSIGAIRVDVVSQSVRPRPAPINFIVPL